MSEQEGQEIVQQPVTKETLLNKAQEVVSTKSKLTEQGLPKYAEAVTYHTWLLPEDSRSHPDTTFARDLISRYDHKQPYVLAAKNLASGLLEGDIPDVQPQNVSVVLDKIKVKLSISEKDRRIGFLQGQIKLTEEKLKSSSLPSGETSQYQERKSRLQSALDEVRDH